MITPDVQERKRKLVQSRQDLFIIGVIITCWICSFFYSNSILTQGILPLGVLGKVVFFIVVFHLSMVTIGIYLHRSQTHMAVEYHYLLRHFFRLWLWLTTGIKRPEWVSIHRAHHQAPDKAADPHSPLIKGLGNLFKKGMEIYFQAKTPETIKKYGYISDNDFLEKYLYARNAGPLCFLLIEIVLFGLWGIVLWTLHMILQIVFQTGVINGLGHYFGYRNFDTKDNSHNIMRWGILIAGEELHNNHHADPTSANFSYRSNEFDVGWLYIRILKKLKLAKLRKESSN